MSQWFECKVKYDKMMENGVLKTVSEPYLVDALSFTEAEARITDKMQPYISGEFSVDTVKRVKFLSDTESRYLSDGDRAVGFVKPYVGGRYAFAALLPAEGTPVADYVASLTGETVISILKNAQNVPVKTEMPKFETQYEIVLNDALSGLGMPDAFDPAAADFTGITESFPAFWIDEVLHKTYIEVGEKGTRAAAVTFSTCAMSFRSSALRVPSTISPT